MAQVYLSIGSNIDRERYINAALSALECEFGEVGLSSVYESVAVGFEGDNFYNLVAAIETEMPVPDLQACIKQIEDQNGRLREGPRFSARTLDIDILTYDDVVGDRQGVVLPREEILENAFVLLPLSELAPEALHPVLQKTYQQLWDEFPNKKQALWVVDFKRH